MEKENEGQKEKATQKKLKILVAIDGSETGEMVVKRSGQLQKVTNCDLTILHVIEFGEHRDTILDHPYFHKKEEAAKKILGKAEKALEEYGIKCKTIKTTGPVASEIVRIADEGDFEIIFVGSRGLGGVKRMLVGSVADKVMRDAECSVMLVRPLKETIDE